jgi:hypothetical protein
MVPDSTVNHAVRAAKRTQCRLLATEWARINTDEEPSAEMEEACFLSVQIRVCPWLILSSTPVERLR